MEVLEKNPQIEVKDKRNIFAETNHLVVSLSEGDSCSSGQAGHERTDPSTKKIYICQNDGNGNYIWKYSGRKRS